jgi:hypothetical protein
MTVAPENLMLVKQLAAAYPRLYGSMIRWWISMWIEMASMSASSVLRTGAD